MDEELALVRDILPLYKRSRNELIPILQEIQNSLGYLPEEAMAEIARYLCIPASHVYAVASFYAQFRLQPLGRKRIAVCRGTACHVRGSTHRQKKSRPAENGRKSSPVRYLQPVL